MADSLKFTYLFGIKKQTNKQKKPPKKTQNKTKKKEGKTPTPSEYIFIQIT